MRLKLTTNGIIAGIPIFLITFSVVSANTTIQHRFLSPSGKYEVVFTEYKHCKFPIQNIRSIDDVNHVVYLIGFFKKEGNIFLAEETFSDVYGWKKYNPTSPELLFKKMVWSPKEDFVILPEEEWGGYPRTPVKKVVALTPELPWRKSGFAFDEFIWIDNLRGIGDYHFDCDFGVSLFDGKSGKTVPTKESASPLGYNLISVKNNKALIGQVINNCGPLEEMEKPPICFEYDLITQEEERIQCPHYDYSRIEISGGSGNTFLIELLLFDPQGRRTGADLITNESYFDIPNAGYTRDEEEEINPRKILQIDNKPLIGIYSLKVMGKALTPYWVRIYLKDADGKSSVFVFESVMAPDMISEYRINYDSTPGKSSSVTRVTTTQSTKQDIKLFYDVGWITNSEVVKSLLSKLDAAENSIKRGQKQTAKNQLNVFINEVNAQKGKHIKDKAVKIFLEDAQYIMDNL
ncbi:MAG: hypothetical protein HY266_09325 [Deltaproteobacteria bacterium]|nr:hypothetical protein [Deltaproteobacteria bacterium]